MQKVTKKDPIFDSDKRPWLLKLIQESDIVIELVDARDIWGTRNHRVEKWAGRDKLIILANKADLATHIEKRDNAVYISAKEGSKTERELIIKLIEEKKTTRPLKVAIIGYPNVGKSSLINVLAKRKAARVAPIAGTTNNIQWVSITENIVLSDSPGVFPKYEKRDELLQKGAVNVDSSTNPEWDAHTLLVKCSTEPVLLGWVSKTFDVAIPEKPTPDSILESIALRRNMKMKGGELNLTEAAKAILRAWKDAPYVTVGRTQKRK